MYDYVIESIDHWVERESEFGELNVADDVLQSEESYHRVIQQMAIERVRMRRARTRATRQVDLELEVKILTVWVWVLGVVASERDRLRLELDAVLCGSSSRRNGMLLGRP